MQGKIFAIMSALLICFSQLSLAQDKEKKEKEIVVFDVSMTCGNCQKRIEKNIAYEKGVTDMQVDLNSKTVTVEFKNKQTDVEKLQAAFEKLGYTAVVHSDQKQQTKEN